MKATTNLTEQWYFQNATIFAKILGQSSSPQSVLPLKSGMTHLGLTDEIKNMEKHEHSLSALHTIKGSSHCTLLQLPPVSTPEEFEHDLTESLLSAMVWLRSEVAHMPQVLAMKVSCSVSLETQESSQVSLSTRAPCLQQHPQTLSTVNSTGKQVTLPLHAPNLSLFSVWGLPNPAAVLVYLVTLSRFFFF